MNTRDPRLTSRVRVTDMRKVLIFILMSTAVALRIPGIFHDFWFDEVWSFLMIRELSSPFDVFTKLMNANNHFLNSLLIYVIDKDNPAHWWKYRIFSLLCGIGTVAMGTLLASKVFKRNAATITTLLLLAVSFPLVIYSSEARGYSSLMFFAVLSIYSLLEYFENKKRLMLVVFNASVIFGFMSHLSFIYIFAGLLTAGIVHLRNSDRAAILKELSRTLLIPFVVLYIMYVRFLTNFLFVPILVIAGGAPDISPLKTLCELPVYIIGLSRLGTFFGIVIWIVIATELYFLIKEKRMFGLFVLTVFLVALCHASLYYPGFSHFRFFVCLFPFLVILFCRFICRFYDAGRKYIFIALIAIVVMSNLYYDTEFIRLGRGNYLQLIKHIERHTAGEIVTIGSDHDFRISKMIEFYGQFSNKRISYISYREMNKATPPEWFIVHSQNSNRAVNPYFEVFKRVFYRLEADYPYFGRFSGFHCTLYRRP